MNRQDQFFGLNVMLGIDGDIIIPEMVSLFIELLVGLWYNVLSILCNTNDVTEVKEPRDRSVLHPLLVFQRIRTNLQVYCRDEKNFSGAFRGACYPFPGLLHLHAYMVHLAARVSICVG